MSRRPREQGAHQVVLTVRATVRRNRVEEVRQTLEAMGAGTAGTPAIPFDRLDRVHFARLMLLEDSTDPDGGLIPASVLYQAELDAPVARHVDALADLGGEGLDAVFAACEGYPERPAPADRARFLRTHAIPSQASYVNTIGRTTRQIRREERLRRGVEDFLDRRRGPLPPTPEAVRAEIQRFVGHDAELAWATRRAPAPSLRWRAGEALHYAAVAVALALALPLALVALPLFALVLRLHELRDAAPHIRPDPRHEHELAALEDHVAQNQFSAIGYVKPGPFRALTLRVVLWLIDVGARHVFTRSNLSGVKTIHFAHWTKLDGGRRVIFTSNYDGSLESYMDDFIDKVAYGLNAVFSAGVGYPRTRFLLFDGAHREQEFKDYLRRHQIPTQVWYSAYPELSASNVENNALLRSGLSGALARPDTEAWLRRL